MLQRHKIFSNPHFNFFFYILLAVGTLAALHLGIHKLGVYARRHWLLEKRQTLLQNSFPEFRYYPYAEIQDIPALEAFGAFAKDFQSAIPARFRVNRAEIYHVFERKQGDTRATIFDLRTIQSGMEGSRSRAFVTSAFLIELDHCSMPTFSLSREGIANISLWGEDPDIDIEGEFVFSKTFHLTGANPDAIRTFFDSSLIAFISSRTNWFSNGLLETTNNTLLFRYGHNLEPEQIRATFDVLMELVEKIQGKTQ